MSCNHKLIADYLCEYIEGTLSPELKTQCQEILQNCQHCQGTYQQALVVYQLANEWQPQAVPAWHRTRYAVRPPGQQTSWLSWGALVTSCVAVFLVVLQLEVSTDNGLLISFGGSQTQARTEELLAQEVEAYRSQQDIFLETQLAQFAERQNMANQLILTEWLERNRGERRDDLNFILTLWESQRYQDQRQLDEQLSYLVTNQIESDQYLNDFIQTVEFPQRGGL